MHITKFCSNLRNYNVYYREVEWQYLRGWVVTFGCMLARVVEMQAATETIIFPFSRSNDYHSRLAWIYIKFYLFDIDSMAR